MLSAVLFDVDGTLVDSNYLHVHAWQRAFDDEGMVVPSWQIHRCIGMDGSRLVRKLSDDAPADVQERLSDKHSQYYREITPLLQPLPDDAQAGKAIKLGAAHEVSALTRIPDAIRNFLQRKKVAA